MRITLAFLLLAGTAALTGCSLFGSKVDPKLVTELAQTPYPVLAPLGEDLDIIVAPGWGKIDLVNRTPNAFENVQLWLNQQYVGKIARLGIGSPAGSGGANAANRFTLNTFINMHGESYPVPGLLTPERGYPIVLAELFDPATGKRHRLLVQLPEDLSRTYYY